MPSTPLETCPVLSCTGVWGWPGGATQVIDLLRQTLTESTKDMDRLVAHYRDELGLGSGHLYIYTRSIYILGLGEVLHGRAMQCWPS